MDGPDRSDRRICIDVGRTIERIEHENVFAAFTSGGNRNNAFGFFRGHDAQVPVVSHDTAHGFLREDVQFRYDIARSIDIAGIAENLCQSRSSDFPRNDFGRQSKCIKKCCEITGRARMHPRFVENMLLNRQYFLHGLDLIT